MNRFLSRLTAGLIVTSLAPNIVLGATGDIYDISRKVVYSKEDNGQLKTDLKSKVVSEGDLYVEGTDGKLHKYHDQKRAEREAIISVLTSKGVDIKDTTAFGEAVVKYSDEIIAEQDLRLSQLERIDPPEGVVKPGEASKLSDVTLECVYDDATREAVVTIVDAVTVNGQPFSSSFVVEISGTIEGNSISARTIRKGDSFRFSAVPDTYTFSIKEREDTPVVESIVETITGTAIDWELNQELSSGEAGLTGNPEDGYTLTYSLVMYDTYVIDDRTLIKPHDKPVVFEINSEVTGSVIHTVEISSQKGEIKLPTMNVVDPTIHVKLPNSDFIKLNVDILPGTFIPSNMVTIEFTQPIHRKIKTVELGANAEASVCELRILQGSSEVYRTNFSGESSLFDVELTEGTYNYVITGGGDSKPLLADGQFVMEYPTPNLIQTNSQALTNSNETVQLAVWHSDVRQPEEDFKVKVVNNLTGESEDKIIQDGKSLVLQTTGAMQSYTLTLYNEDGTLSDTSTVHYINPFDIMPQLASPIVGELLYDDVAEKYIYRMPLKFKSRYGNVYDEFNATYVTVLRLYPQTKSSKVVEIPLTLKDGLYVDMPEGYNPLEYQDYGISFTNKHDDLYGQRGFLGKFPDVTVNELPPVIADPSLDIDFDTDTVAPFLPEDEIVPAPPVETPDLELDFEQEYDTKEGDSNTDASNIEYVELGEITLPSRDEDDEDIVASFELDDDF